MVHPPFLSSRSISFLFFLSILLRGTIVNRTKHYLSKIGKYIPGRLLCVMKVLFTMAPRDSVLSSVTARYTPGEICINSPKATRRHNRIDFGRRHRSQRANYIHKHSKNDVPTKSNLLSVVAPPTHSSGKPIAAKLDKGEIVDVRPTTKRT